MRGKGNSLGKVMSLERVNLVGRLLKNLWAKAVRVSSKILKQLKIEMVDKILMEGIKAVGEVAVIMLKAVVVPIFFEI